VSNQVQGSALQNFIIPYVLSYSDFAACCTILSVNSVADSIRQTRKYTIGTAPKSTGGALSGTLLLSFLQSQDFVANCSLVARTELIITSFSQQFSFTNSLPGFWKMSSASATLALIDSIQYSNVSMNATAAAVESISFALSTYSVVKDVAFQHMNFNSEACIASDPCGCFGSDFHAAVALKSAATCACRKQWNGMDRLLYWTDTYAGCGLDRPASQTLAVSIVAGNGIAPPKYWSNPDSSGSCPPGSSSSLVPPCTVADGPASSATFSGPTSISVGPDGSIFVGDQPLYGGSNEGSTRLRKISKSGTVTSLAGNEHPKLFPADGIGSFAVFSGFSGVAVDPWNSVFVADSANNNIRKIWSNQTVITFAGSRNAQLADGVGTFASFSNPNAVVSDLFGNLIVADTGNYRICRVTAAGTVTTLAGAGYQGSADGVGTSATFMSPRFLAVDSGGYVYVLDGEGGWNGAWIRKISPLGDVRTLKTFCPADGCRAPTLRGLAVDTSGTLYYAADTSGSFSVITLAANGNESTVVAASSSGSPMTKGIRSLALGADGTLYMAQYLTATDFIPGSSTEYVGGETNAYTYILKASPYRG
jgi:sugar lactone lactonase YvrE